MQSKIIVFSALLVVLLGSQRDAMSQQAASGMYSLMEDCFKILPPSNGEPPYEQYAGEYLIFPADFASGYEAYSTPIIGYLPKQIPLKAGTTQPFPTGVILSKDGQLFIVLSNELCYPAGSYSINADGTFGFLPTLTGYSKTEEFLNRAGKNIGKELPKEKIEEANKNFQKLSKLVMGGIAEDVNGKPFVRVLALYDKEGHDPENIETFPHDYKLTLIRVLNREDVPE